MPRNDGFEYRERLGADAAGRRLIDWLTSRYRHSSESEWRERIDSGRVLVDSNPAGPGTLLSRGGELVWIRPPWDEPDAPLSFELLHEDPDLVAVAKPAGLPTLPGAGFLQSTLLHQVRLRFPGVSPLHRLGRFTSGVVLFARTPRAGARLTSQWVAREVGKRYRALACGRPASSEFAIETPIGRLPHAILGSIHAATPDGKASSSRVVVIEQRADAFLCDVTIATGRPHQIRIHLAAAGHPLFGDPLYGPGGIPLAGTRALPGDPGYHLHAAELTFRHPATGRELVIACPPPPVLCIGATAAGV